jgi:general secretion pathway protein K
MSDIEWQRIKTSLIFLPQITTININTASATLIYASISNINQSDADNIIAYRNKQPFKSISDLKTYLNDSGLANLQQNAFVQLGVSSQFFIAQAEIKHDQTIFVRNSLIERGLNATSGNNTRIIWEIDPRDM